MLKTVIRIALALLILGAAIAIAAVMMNDGDGPEGDGEGLPATEVDALSITPDAWAPQAQWTGEVVVRQRAEVTVPVEADVNDVLVDLGQSVVQGERLVDLDTEEAERDLALAQSDLRELEISRAQTLAQHALDQDMLDHERELLEQAERSLAREQGLRDRGASTEAALEEARGRVVQARQALRQRESSVDNHANDLAQLDAQEARAQINLTRREEALERARTPAPFDGVIDDILVAEGQRVAAGQTLLSLYGTNSLKWRVSLPRAAQGDFEAHVDGAWVPLERRSARVTEGASSRYGEFALPADVSWAPGEIHEARVQWPAIENTQLIPSSSLYSGNRIFLINDEERLETFVVDTLGTRWHNGDEYWVIDATDLPEDGRILTTRLANILSGMEVSIADTERLTVDSAGE